MENDVFGSVEDIDAKLDEEFGKEVATEPNEEENVSVETNTVEETEEVSNEEPEKEQEEKVEKPAQVEDEGKSDSKKEYAFSNLRAENTNLKKERDEYKANSEYLKELAARYGYDDVQKFQEAVRTAQDQKAAQEKGYDPVLYKKAMDAERRIAELEREREEQKTQIQLDRFQTALSDASKTYNIDEQEILSRLDEEGVTVEEILSSSNHKLLINGVLVDKIKDSAKQNQIENLQNLKNLAEDKNEQGGSVSTVTIDSLLRDDLADYKKNNFFD